MSVRSDWWRGGFGLPHRVSNRFKVLHKAASATCEKNSINQGLGWSRSRWTTLWAGGVLLVQRVVQREAKSLLISETHRTREPLLCADGLPMIAQGVSRRVWDRWQGYRQTSQKPCQNLETTPYKVFIYNNLAQNWPNRATTVRTSRSFACCRFSCR